MVATPFSKTLDIAGESIRIVSLEEAGKNGFAGLSDLPRSLKVLAENILRRLPPEKAEEEIAALATSRGFGAISFHPARVLLQDLLGGPLMVDLAALREALAARGEDPKRVNPVIPADLVIDHSLMAVFAGMPGAQDRNEVLEYGRNAERYTFFKWCQRAFDNVRILPPGRGIMHQINIEYLARVVWSEEVGGKRIAYPDTLVGTDSHTPMVNGLGVVGWGVGGIEAESAMLGRALSILAPQVIGMRLEGTLAPGVTATDLVLTITERLRKLGVVGKFVEFFGDGLKGLSAANRSTIANMAPEYGATCVYFPIDDETLSYLALTGRDEAHVRLVEAYAKEQGLWRTGIRPGIDEIYDEVVTLDLGSVETSLAGPSRPQDRIVLEGAADAFTEELAANFERDSTAAAAGTPVRGMDHALKDGDVVIAAITSCTNTSNPENLITAGLLAKKAVERGITRCPWVKTSLAPGSRAVTYYLEAAGLQPYLDRLGFNLVGYGCTTCGGMSGPLDEPVAEAVRAGDHVAVAVLSGNRNFEARIHPLAKANYLASPPLVVAYALAGTMRVDLTREPLARDAEGRPVYLSELWPSPEEIEAAVRAHVDREQFVRAYADAEAGDSRWQALEGAGGDLFQWDDASTYVRRPPFADLGPVGDPVAGIAGMRPLAILGDSITTDHISPSGAIAPTSAAGQYLIARGIGENDFNSYGTRRANHEVGMRATFANIRLNNEMVSGRRGSVTRLMPDGKEMSVFEAGQAYAERGVPTIVIAGKEYGCGSSRDWAAKGVRLLGVRVVLAESFERIHRSNLVRLGVIPAEFPKGLDRHTLGLDGSETFDLRLVADALSVAAEGRMTIHRTDGTEREIPVRLRLDTLEEVDCVKAGGILPLILGEITNQAKEEPVE